MTRTIARILALAVLLVSVGLVGGTAQAATLTVGQYESQIATLVNQARANAGLAPLQVDVSLGSVARTWSQKMASSGTFAHNPSYTSQYPTGWTRAAENIAMGGTSSGQYPASSIHANLMGSTGHRANILDPRLNRLGVGVAFVSRSGMQYVYVTQNFATYATTLAPVPAPSGADTPFRQVVATRDQTGDGLGDTLAVDGAGRLYLFAGRGDGRPGAETTFGTGWGSLTVYAPGDWNGDRRNDVVATDRSGALWLYPGNGAGGFGARSQIGYGWSGLRIIPSGDVNRDGISDLLAIDAGGRLWAYPGAGGGTFHRRAAVGNGWSGFQLHAGGDMNRDGATDIFSIDSGGRLYFYAGLGSGLFAKRTQVGQGWGGFVFASGADLNTDGLADLLGRDSSGRLWFYGGRLGGSFRSAAQVASGW